VLAQDPGAQALSLTDQPHGGSADERHPDFEFLLRRQEQLNASNRDGALTAPGSTRVLVAESNRLVAEALMLAIDVEPTLEPIGYALDGWEAIELIERLGPDVIVIGAKLAGLDAFTLTGLLNEFWPSVSAYA